MNRTGLLTLGRYVGVAATAFVPALVVAQALPIQGNLQPGRVLLANDILLMRNALENAQAEINNLKAAVILKSRIYQRASAVAAPAPATPEVSATCDNEGDLMIHCGCRGIANAADPNPLGGANNTSMDLRRVLMVNPSTTPRCSCQAQNQGTNAEAGLVAVATCVPIGVE